MSAGDLTYSPGWFGKMPSLGDFASRRLSADFMTAWDAWLQRSIAASRATLDARWLDMYLTSPIWRFLLMPGVIGKRSWSGVLMPSVDKVGRYFPLTIAVALPDDDAADPLRLVRTARTWYEALDEIALAALGETFSPDDLEQHLAAATLPLDELAPARDSALAVALAQWWLQSGAPARRFDVENTELMKDALDATGQHLLHTTGSGKAIWWCEIKASGRIEMHCTAGLPDEDYFAVLLSGGRSLPTHVEAQASSMPPELLNVLLQPRSDSEDGS